ncbi:MAG: hypothetical protein JSV75_00725, partial [Candidatus Bathyarchaeota archaeon]
MKSKKSGVLILSALTLLVISTVLVSVCAQPETYWKASYTDYAPSGMPDFDQKQWGTYNWTNFGTWSHCGPVAVANSLWWYDSAYEISGAPPPAIIDNFNLVTSYNPGGWDDHDPLNVQPFVEHLAHLMDTDGSRTGLVHLGTNVSDMETGVAQYLSWSGVNPQGDVDGNGIVDATDLTIVNTAMGSSPGIPGWNMAADIWPATSGWPVPGVSDNVIDGNDLNLVTTNMNRSGMFYEHTVPTPDFYLIEEEVERCQDVVLILGFYVEVGPGQYFREDYPYPYGHAVTVAGVNSATMQIAISDPVVDAFEMGLAPGRSPVPHLHMPPEPPYITHNDASLVSHDVYNVTFDVVMGMWKLVGYGGLPTPPFHVLIESAVITSSESTSPNIVVLSPENKTYSVDSIPLDVIVDETPSWMGYSLDSQANNTIVGNTTLMGLLDGSHSVVVYANDTAGNMGTSTMVYFTVDTTPPNITEVSQIPLENNVQPEDEVKVNATVTDDISGVKQVILNYTNGNGTWITAGMTNLQGNIWNGLIPPFEHSTYVNYTIVAEDNVGHIITTDETNAYQYQVIPEF